MRRYVAMVIVCALVRQAGGTGININGVSAIYQSTGAANGNAWVLDRDGYLGTYISLAAPGNVTVGVNANGVAAAGVAPHLNVSIADSSAGFNVTSGNHDYSSSYQLPAGTYFVRVQFDNDLELSARQLTVNTISVNGATIQNAATAQNALAASDSYIANYRRGQVTVGLAGLGVAAGTPVNVSMKRLAFNWGNAVPGFKAEEVDSYMGTAGTAKQINYQAKLLQNFNAVTVENAGKWIMNEYTPGLVDMDGVDQILSFAAAHNLNARLHNELWDDAQPPWVDTLKTAAAAGDPLAKANLRSAISNRTNYYLPPRATQIREADIYNESYQGQCCNGDASYWNIYGASGIAGIYNEAKQALGASGVKLSVNDFETLMYEYGNAAGYFPHIEALQQAAVAAGYGKIIDTIGTQHYPWNIALHSPSDMFRALQSYSVTGLPQSITEFGVMSGVAPADAATMLGDTMRLEFGNPLGTGMFLWGFQAEDGGGNLFAPAGALYNVSTTDWNTWSITPAGKAWQDKLGIQDWDNDPTNGWNTQLTATTDSHGNISFNGYYGDYQITVGGRTYNLSIAKGTSNYALGIGDFNFDGRIDAADYVAWRKKGGVPDAYQLWRANFGSHIAAGAEVPEPGGWLLLAVSAAAYPSLFMRRGRTSSSR